MLSFEIRAARGLQGIERVGLRRGEGHEAHMVGEQLSFLEMMR